MRRRALLSVVTIVAAVLSGVSAPAARADGPGVGTPWVVTVGDSYISGEAGRWAGNTNNGELSKVDALGTNRLRRQRVGTPPSDRRCHRSKPTEAYIGGGVVGHDLACSGTPDGELQRRQGVQAGPRLYNSGGQEGQALMLQDSRRHTT